MKNLPMLLPASGGGFVWRLVSCWRTKSSDISSCPAGDHSEDTSEELKDKPETEDV